MKIITLLENFNLSNEQKQQLLKYFNTLHNKVADKTGIKITPKWVAGLLNQIQRFGDLDNQYKSYLDNRKTSEANDVLARIVVRDSLLNSGLISRDGNIVTPKNNKVLSNMRQFYTRDIHADKEKSDIQKSMRSMADQDYTEWLDKLPELAKSFVVGLQELTPEEIAEFKGIVKAKEGKKEFVQRLYDWTNTNDVAANTFKKMGLLNDNNSINMENMEIFRTFIEGLSPARLEDVLSKASVFSGKKITHDTHRAKNKVLKDVEFGNNLNSKVINIYNKLSDEVQDAEDKISAVKRRLVKIPGAVDNGKITDLGKGVFKLFRVFNGQPVEMQDAIDQLNYMYQNSGTRDRRVKKAETRGQTLSNQNKI